MGPTLEYGSANSPTGSAYYRPTNELRTAELLIAVTVALVVTVAAGVAYAWAIQWFEHFLIRPALPVAFGGLLGLTWSIAVAAAGVRRRRMGFALALIGTLLGFYVAWVVWEVFALRRFGAGIQWLDLRNVGPLAVYKLGRLINMFGTWGFQSKVGLVRGTPLLWIWVAEALVIFGSAVAGSLLVLNDRAYCHTCKRQCPPPERIFRMNIGEPREAKTRLEALDVEFFRPLVLPPIWGDHFWSLQFEGCRGCESLTMLNLLDVSTTRGKNGNSTVKRRPLVKRLMVDAARMETFIAALLPDVEAESKDDVPLEEPAPSEG